MPETTEATSDATKRDREETVEEAATKKPKVVDDAPEVEDASPAVEANDWNDAYAKHIKKQAKSMEDILCGLDGLHELDPSNLDDEHEYGITQSYLISDWIEAIAAVDDEELELYICQKAGLEAYPEEDEKSLQKMNQMVVDDAFNFMEKRGSLYFAICNQLCGFAGFAEEEQEIKDNSQKLLDNMVSFYKKINPKTSTIELSESALKKCIQSEPLFKNLLNCYEGETLTPDDCLKAMEAMDETNRATFVEKLNCWGRVNIFDRGNINDLHQKNNEIKMKLHVLNSSDTDLLTFIYEFVQIKVLLNTICCQKSEEEEQENDNDDATEEEDIFQEKISYVNLWEQMKEIIISISNQ